MEPQPDVRNSLLAIVGWAGQLAALSRQQYGPNRTINRMADAKIGRAKLDPEVSDLEFEAGEAEHIIVRKFPGSCSIRGCIPSTERSGIALEQVQPASMEWQS